MNKSFDRLDDVQVLGLTIYLEARGESVEGQIAVGSVILERVDHRDWDGSTIKEVCYKKWQFSCYNEGDPQYSKALHIAEHWDAEMATNMSLNAAHAVAVGLIDGKIPRSYVLARLHCCQYLNPRDPGGAETKAYWLRSGMKSIAAIGNHEFFV